MLSEDINKVIQAEVHDHTVPRVMIISMDGYMRPDLRIEFLKLLKEAVPAWSFLLLEGGQRFTIRDDIHKKKAKS